MFNSILKNIETFNKENNDASIEVKEPEPKIIKEYRGNQFELDSWLNRMQYNEYIKNNSKNKKVIKNKREAIQFENETTCYNAVEQASIKKKWARLDIYTKKNRIDEYLNRLQTNGTITETNKIEFRTKYHKMISDKTLKTKDILYDDNEGIIKDIYTLKVTEVSD